MQPVTCLRFARSRRLPHPRRRLRQWAQILTATTTAARAEQSTSAPDAQPKRRALGRPPNRGRTNGRAHSARRVVWTKHLIASAQVRAFIEHPSRRCDAACRTHQCGTSTDGDEAHPRLYRKAAFRGCDAGCKRRLAPTCIHAECRRQSRATAASRRGDVHPLRGARCLEVMPQHPLRC